MKAAVVEKYRAPLVVWLKDEIFERLRNGKVQGRIVLGIRKEALTEGFSRQRRRAA